VIEILRGLPAWQALWKRLDAAGWGDAAEPGRRTAFNGLGHAIWQMRQNPAEAESWCVVVLHAGLLDHGIRGLATYRELTDRLELEYMGAAQAGQGAGTVLLRYLAAEAAARHVPLTLSAYASAAGFYRRHGMAEAPAQSGRPLARFTFSPAAAAHYAQTGRPLPPLIRHGEGVPTRHPGAH
jgi:GNAT superfamily N-acetyltransferase